MCGRDEHYCADHRPAATTAVEFGSGDRALYREFLDGERRTAFEAALHLRTLEPEIALIRVLIGEHAEEPETVRKLVATLVRAVQIERSLSTDDATTLSIQIQQFLTSLELLPAESSALDAGRRSSG